MRISDDADIQQIINAIRSGSSTTEVRWIVTHLMANNFPKPLPGYAEQQDNAVRSWGTKIVVRVIANSLTWVSSWSLCQNYHTSITDLFPLFKFLNFNTNVTETHPIPIGKQYRWHRAIWTAEKARENNSRQSYNITNLNGHFSPCCSWEVWIYTVMLFGEKHETIQWEESSWLESN